MNTYTKYWKNNLIFLKYIINYDNKKWIVNSSFQVTHTDLNGISKLFVVGRYTDTLVMNSNHFLLQGRLVKLETRDLGVGLHVPI